MIIATLEYNPEAFGPMVKSLLRERLMTLRDCLEAITGKVFEDEQDKINVRIRPFGEFDEYEDDLFFTFDVLDEHLHHKPSELVNQLAFEIANILYNFIGNNITFKACVKTNTGSALFP